MNPPLTPAPVATRRNIALTHRGVEALRPQSEAYRICDLRCPGLAVRVAPSGLKTWDVAYRIRRQGTYRRLSLGPFPAVGLDAARERAKALTDAAKAGRDLIEEERQTKAAQEARLTVRQLIEIYLTRQVRGGCARHTKWSGGSNAPLRRSRIATPTTSAGGTCG